MSEKQQVKVDDKRGRPKDLSLNTVILATTINLIAENGYDALTVDAVAKEAKVGKGTIYRRWSTKKELIIDAVILMCPFETTKETLDKNKSIREQFIDLLNLLCVEENKNYHVAMEAVSKAVARDEQAKIQQAFNQRYGKVVETILAPFIQDHSLTENEVQLIADIGPGLITYKNQFDQTVDIHQYIEDVVDKLILPLLPEKAD
ncbi:hypothetical protein BAU15_11845 [Enterococcus sp. JM4C]|nr:hypothetical protein BAU15_11845 [Enterococcus sp. JM4C]